MSELSLLSRNWQLIHTDENKIKLVLIVFISTDGLLYWHLVGKKSSYLTYRGVQ
jgi:hypothetical protein